MVGKGHADGSDFILSEPRRHVTGGHISVWGMGWRGRSWRSGGWEEARGDGLGQELESGPWGQRKENPGRGNECKSAQNKM